ncbi:PEP-CTERM sorting domain-containing protein [Phycisphaera mikurensis]|uniref:PEP-CTERM protein-sorting domain-containing protein n=1 Tax=Phycisphaera mikurensis (strain NBRC 102666 / KCTC 22515 / FYK2301M01) TaxID=1142394 RepID=I0IFC1_PHYMF|nr:PEP-CTERM sorting domain-containing protein [Phycisphaera mikurensis]MBB6440648.1 hypothetical protein [Phycisphaera mikurensis]BAM03959.1 hypothetical protein PSMK_18000 [Phycisphaera mikurensis NBRC 102666]
MSRSLCFVTATAASFALVAPSASAAPIVLSDGFQIGGTGLNTNVNADLATRQSGTAAPLTLAEATAGTSPNNDAFIQNDFGAFGSDALLLRTTASPGGGANQTAVQVGGLGAVIGTQYTISFDYHMSFASGAGNARFLGFTLSGDTAAATPGGDFAIVLRENGDQTTFEDGTATGAPNVPYSTSGGEVSTIQLLVDETLATPTVTVTLSDTFGTDTATLAPVAIDFEAADTGRFLEIRGSQSGGTTFGGSVGDFRIDNLQVEIVPEPSTAALAAAGAGLMLLRRRSAR